MGGCFSSGRGVQPRMAWLYPIMRYGRQLALLSQNATARW